MDRDDIRSTLLTLSTFRTAVLRFDDRFAGPSGQLLHVHADDWCDQDPDPEDPLCRALTPEDPGSEAWAGLLRSWRAGKLSHDLGTPAPVAFATESHRVAWQIGHTDCRGRACDYAWTKYESAAFLAELAEWYCKARAADSMDMARQFMGGGN